MNIFLALSFQANEKIRYKDFVVSDTNIIGLTEKGKLIFFDKEYRKKTDNIDTPPKAVLLTKNRLGEIVVVDEKKRVNKYIKDKKTVDSKTKLYLHNN
ncbi:MAG: hypothetical protein WC123_07710 [Bacilli bacterium]